MEYINHSIGYYRYLLDVCYTMDEVYDELMDYIDLNLAIETFNRQEEELEEALKDPQKWEKYINLF